MIGHQYLVGVAALSLCTRAVGRMSVERLRIQRCHCIMICSMVVSLFPTRIWIILLLYQHWVLVHIF